MLLLKRDTTWDTWRKSITLDEEYAADEESKCSIHKCNNDMEDKVDRNAESPLKATPVEGTTIWTDEKPARIGVFLVCYLEEVMEVKIYLTMSDIFEW